VLAGLAVLHLRYQEQDSRDQAVVSAGLEITYHPVVAVAQDIPLVTAAHEHAEMVSRAALAVVVHGLTASAVLPRLVSGTQVEPERPRLPREAVAREALGLTATAQVPLVVTVALERLTLTRVHPSPVVAAVEEVHMAALRAQVVLASAATV
jgi:hypothetical protein